MSGDCWPALFRSDKVSPCTVVQCHSEGERNGSSTCLVASCWRCRSEARRRDHCFRFASSFLTAGHLAAQHRRLAHRVKLKSIVLHTRPSWHFTCLFLFSLSPLSSLRCALSNQNYLQFLSIWCLSVCDPARPTLSTWPFPSPFCWVSCCLLTLPCSQAASSVKFSRPPSTPESVPFTFSVSCTSFSLASHTPW